MARQLPTGGWTEQVAAVHSTTSAEPAIDVIEPLLNGGIIQFDAGDLALDPAEPRHNLVELAINAVETIVETRETSAQKVENVVSLAHA